MYARDRSMPLATGYTLSERVIAADLDEAGALIDCEISFGCIIRSDWIIEASSLPYRERASIVPILSNDTTQFESTDVEGDGTPIKRLWNVVEIEGDMSSIIAGLQT
jgi:hypothetical protein